MTYIRKTYPLTRLLSPSQEGYDLHPGAPRGFCYIPRVFLLGVGRMGLEPIISRLSAECINQLCYLPRCGTSSRGSQTFEFHWHLVVDLVSKHSRRVGGVGLEPTMPEGDGVTIRCNTNSAHPPIWSGFNFPSPKPQK